MKRILTILVLTLGVLIFLSLFFVTHSPQAGERQAEKWSIEYRPIKEIAGKTRVYVNVIPRERIPGTNEGNSPWIEYPAWKPEMSKLISSWEAKAKEMLVKSGFTIVNDDAKADFIIYVGTDAWCNGDAPCMHAYIVSAEKNIHPANRKAVIYYQYRLVEVNPEPSSPRIAKDQWLDTGINGFLWAYKK